MMRDVGPASRDDKQRTLQQKLRMQGEIARGKIMRYRGLLVALSALVLVACNGSGNNNAGRIDTSTPVGSTQGSQPGQQTRNVDCSKYNSQQPSKPTDSNYYYVKERQCGDGLLGASARFSVEQPKVEKRYDWLGGKPIDLHSLAEVAVIRWIDGGKHANAIEAGWTVRNTKGEKPRFFIKSSLHDQEAPGSDTALCYQVELTQCGGFKWEAEPKPGAELPVGTTADRTTADIDIERSDDKWIVSVNSKEVGYFLVSAWEKSEGFESANDVQWYGEATRPGSLVKWACVEMGNGKVGDDADAAFIDHMMVKTDPSVWQAADATASVTEPTTYNINSSYTGNSFRYGGRPVGLGSCGESAQPNPGGGSVKPNTGDGRPDLMPISTSADPECGAADLEGGVINKSSVVTGSFQVAWTVDATVVKTGTVTGLSTNVAQSGLSVHQQLSAGSHKVTFVVDSNEAIPEANESNNTWTDTITVPSCPLSQPPTATTTPAPPNPPSNLTVVATDSYHIRISWQDNSNNEASFEVNNGNESRTVGQNLTSYVWPSTPGSYMCVRVRAVNSAGASPWEPSVSPFYRCTTTPGANNPTTPTQSTPNPSTNLTTPDGTPCTGPLGQNGVIRNGQCYLGTAM